MKTGLSSLSRSRFAFTTLVGTLLAGLTASAPPALGFQVETATVRLERGTGAGRGDGDTVHLKGLVEGLSLDPFPDLAVALGPFHEVVASDAVVLDEDGNYIYTAPANRPGISVLKFDPTKSELSVMAGRLDLAGLENPAVLRLVTPAGNVCVRLAFDVYGGSKQARKEIWRFQQSQNRQEPCYLVVPDVVGLTVGDAEALLAASGFVPGATLKEFDPGVPAGAIVLQHPAAGSTAERGTAVDLVVSLGAQVDADGVDAAVENAAPGGGDGNGDGVPDGEQANVASLPNVEDGRYLTLVSPPDTYLENVVSSSAGSIGSVPDDVAFPLGLLGFEVHLRAPGGSATVTLLLPPGVELSSYHRYGPTPSDPTPHWYEFLFDGETGAELFRDRVVLHLTDGARGDDDLDGTNGVIVDSGGPSTGPCGSDHVFDLAIGQWFECVLPLIGTGPETWALTNNGVAQSVLPAGLELVEAAGRWYIHGTVAPDAALARHDVLLLGTSADASEEIRIFLDVNQPFTVWTQNTLLRPEDLIPTSLIIGTCAEGLLYWAAAVSCGILTAIEINYDNEVQNTSHDNWQRAQSILARLPSYDIVGLQEVFSTPVDHERLEWFQDNATRHLVIPGPDASSDSFPPHGSSGLALLVKWGLAPFLTQTVDLTQHRQEVYAAVDENTSDHLAQKGFTLDRVHIDDNPDHFVWVVNTHTQATESQAIESTADVRVLQLHQLRQALDAIPDRDHPVLIMGDFNIDAQEPDPSEYLRMLSILGIDEDNALLPRFGPADAVERLTIDRLRNPYAFYWFWGEPMHQELDHMLVRQGRRYGILVRHIEVTDDTTRTDLCDKHGPWEFPPGTNPEPQPPATLTCYLSDHYGIGATLGLYSTAPTVTITQPADGDVLVEGQMVVLVANAGSRSDLLSRFRWTSDRAGDIGSGSWISWIASMPGPHRITASVTDFDGLVYTASIDVVVEADDDRDGLSNRREGELGTDPADADTDDDGLDDRVEVEVYNTNPLSPDTDGDGLSDGTEIALGSNPLIGDSDQDGLADADEAALGTDPAAADSDGDGVWDGAELVLGSDPMSSESVPGSLPTGSVLGADSGFLAVIDPLAGRVGRIGQPAGGFGFSLAADGTGTVFVGDFFEGALLTTDPLSALSTRVGPLQTATGEPIDVLTLAFNPVDGFLYGPEEGHPCLPDCPLSGQLLRIDRASGEVTRVGVEGPDPIRALTFDTSGRLYAIITRNGVDRLGELDPSTGVMLQDIGETGFPGPVFGLAFDAGGELLATAPRDQAFQTDLLVLDTGTGVATPRQVLDGRVFDLAVGKTAGGGLILVEDFTDDGNPSVPGLAATDFVHSFSNTAWTFADETLLPTQSPYPSSPHALWLFAATDTVTFPGRLVDTIKVHVSTQFTGGAQVVVYGSGDVKTFDLLHADWQVVQCSSSEAGDAGNPMGSITSVVLAGGEAIFDDIEIRVP